MKKRATAFNELYSLDKRVNPHVCYYCGLPSTVLDYAKLLRAPEWTEEELNELGYNLRQYIEETAKAARLTRERLSW